MLCAICVRCANLGGRQKLARAVSGLVDKGDGARLRRACSVNRGTSPGADADRLFRFGTLLRRPGLPGQTERAVDQADMAVSLREIPQHPTALRIELYVQQTNNVRVC